MSETNNRLGIWLMVATTFVFAMQDGLSQHLASGFDTRSWRLPISAIEPLNELLYFPRLFATRSGGLGPTLDECPQLVSGTVDFGDARRDQLT